MAHRDGRHLNNQMKLNEQTESVFELIAIHSESKKSNSKISCDFSSGLQWIFSVHKFR